MQPQHGALLAVHLLLGVGRHEERHHRARRARRGLDHVRHVVLVGRLVEVLEPLPGVLGVLREVVVAAIGDALELAPAPREEELDVGVPDE